MSTTRVQLAPDWRKTDWAALGRELLGKLPSAIQGPTGMDFRAGDDAVFLPVIQAFEFIRDAVDETIRARGARRAGTSGDLIGPDYFDAQARAYFDKGAEMTMLTAASLETTRPDMSANLRAAVRAIEWFRHLPTASTERIGRCQTEGCPGYFFDHSSAKSRTQCDRHRRS
jgi:predicted RNA-binding Zn ribbon-like protein